MDREFSIPTLRTIFNIAGLTNSQSDRLARVLMTWLRSNGSQWVIDRIKVLRNWYITTIAGVPDVPAWCAHTASGYPKGAWRPVWDLPMQHALLALSVSTLFPPEKEVTESQRKKFLDGVNATMSEESTVLLAQCKPLRLRGAKAIGLKVHKRKHRVPDMVIPTQTCINSKAVAVKHGRVLRVNPGNPNDAAKAYVESWKAIPEPVVEWLWDQGKLDWAPPYAVGNAYQVLDSTKANPFMGAIALLQQEEGKGRWVANLNKVVQQLLDPLSEVWYEEVRRNWQHDCTFDESYGTQVVQRWLREGITLSGADMSSATDLLDLESCLWIVNQAFFSDLMDNPAYLAQLDLFKRVSRGLWWSEDLGKEVTWKQGQPLGARPSFALLTLTNYCLAQWACALSGLEDTFMVHGDDVILDSRALDKYVWLVKSFGGVINLEKTLTSNRVAEFNGKIISPELAVNKRFYLRCFDDDSFLDYAKWIGPGAERLLRPRQKAIWEAFRFVPGVVTGGPFPTDSYGYSLADRLEWWETVKPHHQVPDAEDKMSIGESLWYTSLRRGHDQTEWDWEVPQLVNDESSYQELESKRPPSGDPRKWSHRKTLLAQLEHLMSDNRKITDYQWHSIVDLDDPLRRSWGQSVWRPFQPTSESRDE